MLDALKGLTGGNKAAQKQADEFQTLIAAAREERSALNTMLTQITMRSSRLSQIGKTLGEVDEKAAAAAGRLTDVDTRVAGLEDRLRTFGEIDKRIESLLLGTAREAQQSAEKLIAPDSDIQKHRQSIQQLSSHALEAQASIEALKREQTTLQDFRKQLRQSQQDIETTLKQAAAVKGELDQVRGTAGQLAQDYARLRETSREVREDSAATADTVKDLEKKLGPLMQLQELSKTTEEKLSGLNALAEHVSQKAKALEGQKHTVERAVLEANRLNEMVWSMDVQINKLHEALKDAHKSEETVGRIEALVQQANVTVEAITKARDDLARQSVRFEKDGRTLMDGLRASLDRVSLEKKDIDALETRLRALQGTAAEAEARMEALAVKERSLSQLHQKVDVLNKDFQGLTTHADELSRKQASLESLHERLGQVEDLAKRTAQQHDALLRGRQDLDALRQQIQDFHKSYADMTPAPRQAVRRPHGAREFQRADDSVHGAHPGARRDAQRHQRETRPGGRGRPADVAPRRDLEPPRRPDHAGLLAPPVRRQTGDPRRCAAHACGRR